MGSKRYNASVRAKGRKEESSMLNKRASFCTVKQEQWEERVRLN